MGKEVRVYSSQQELFLAALSDPQNKGNLRKCMELAGYSKTTPVNYVVNALSEEIVELANKMIATNAVRGATAILEVLESPGDVGAKVKLAAAANLLDRAGVNKKTDDVRINVGGGLIILPAKAINMDGLTAKTIEGTYDEA